MADFRYYMRCNITNRTGPYVFADLNLDHRLQLGLADLPFDTPTEVQRELVPKALAGGDFKVRAETGSGKTLAYLVPLVQRLLSSDIPRNAGTLALILVPTRELARQVLKDCRTVIAKSHLKANAITGGADFKYQRSIFRANPEIIIATPGRMREHCERGSADLAALQTLVLDEADRTLDLGLREDVLFIADKCPAPQVFMLSATLKHKGLSAVSKQLLKEPQTLSLGEVRQAHSAITHQRLLADHQDHKDKLLLALLQRGGYQRAMVFANKRATANRLGALLRRQDLRADVLQGDMSTEKRKLVVARIKSGKLDILCASDVAARGLDIEGVDLVVNYDLPYSGDDYVHRSGRTGRAGATGLAISLITAPDWNRMIGIERYLNTQFEHLVLPGLKARYNGPKKTKGSGKAAGTRKKAKKPADKAASRQRNRSQKGKPKRDNGGNDGFAPLTKKRS